MFRWLHMMALCAALFYHFTSLRSLVLVTMGQHPIPLPCTVAMQIPVSRKNVKIRNKIFRSARPPAITVTLSQEIHEAGYSPLHPYPQNGRDNVGSPRLIT